MLRKPTNAASQHMSYETQAPRRGNFQAFGDTHNFPRSTQGKFVLPKKYALSKPEKKDINGRLGPPDFFPLDVTAPEDALKQKSIIEGLIEPRLVNDESGSLRKYFGNNGVNIHNIKTDLLQSVHEIEWKRSVSPKEKERGKRTTTAAFPEQVVTNSQFRESWIARLAGTEPLHRLAVQVPHGFKGDPLLKALIDSNIPALRATWFIKIIYLNMKQNRQKNPIDPTGDWTTTLVRFFIQLLKELTGNKPVVDKGERYVRPGYILKLVKWSYCEGLLDKDKFFGFMMEQLAETPRTEDVHAILHVLLQYMEDIATSAAHSRRLLSHINARLGRVGLKYISQKVELEGALKAISQVLSKEVFYAKPFGQLFQDISSLNLPQIVEALDHSLISADLDLVYNSIFPENIQDILARIHLVCEWAITDHRSNDFSACIAVNILKKCTHKLVASTLLHSKLPLQGILIEFLEACEYSPRLWLLYGELLRCGLFSHDGYVRHLISRGRLESNSPSYRVVLEQLPIFDYDITRNKRPAALHERNQRRAILNGLPTDSMDYDQSSHLNSVVELIVTSVEGGEDLPVLELLHKLSLHDKWVVSEWLTASVMNSIYPGVALPTAHHTCALLSNFLAIASCTSGVMRIIFYILRAVNDYRGLATLICWLLQHCTYECVLLVAISTARDMVHMFIAQDMLTELLSTLVLVRYPSNKAQISTQNFFAELINAYHKVPAVQKYDTMIKPSIHAAPSITTQQKANRELEHLWLSSHPQLSEHTIIGVAESIYGLDSALRMQTVLNAVLSSCANLSTAQLRRQLSVFATLIEHIYARLGPTDLVHDFKAILAALPPTVDRNTIAGLIAMISVQQVLPTAVLITNVLIPLLQENITKLSISGVLTHTELLVFFICTLLGHDYIGEVICKDERIVFLHSGKLSSLSVVLPPTIQLYSQLQTNSMLALEKGSGVQEAISKNIAAILQECDFVRICVTEPGYVYRHLQSLGLSMRRQVFHMLSKGVQQCLPLRSHDYMSTLTHANMNDIAPKIVVQVLNEVVEQHWIVQYSWLQLQLVLDEWLVVDANVAVQTFVDLLFNHLTANWTFYTVYSKLIELLGPRIQRQIVKAAIAILENQFSGDSIASSLVELSYHLKSTKGTFTLEEDGLGSAFVGVILTSLQEVSPADREEYVASIEQQLRRLTTGSVHLDILAAPQQVVHAVQCGVWIRLKLLAALYPLTRTPDMASTLVGLLSKSFLSAGENEAGLELVPLLLSTIGSLLEESDDTSRRLTNKMKETYMTIRTLISPQHRANVETVLGITPTTTSSTTTTIPTNTFNDPAYSWTLLEDYQDGPLSPSMLGGTRVDRGVPTYAHQAFERSETPVKRLRIV